MYNLKKALKSIFNIVKNAEFIWIFDPILVMQNNVKNAVKKSKAMLETAFFINSNIFIINSSLTSELYIKWKEESERKCMNELLKINTSDSERITVSARELHKALEVNTDFNHWFTRMCEYGFEDGKDFATFLSESTGGRPSQDAQITVDMAKEIAMLQRTEKGKEVRKYFIQIEKEWNSPERVMARALTIANKTIETLKIENSEMKPKADYFDNLVERNLLTNFRDTAKELGLRQTDLINNLIEDGYVYRDQKSKLKPYAEYGKTGKGLFELKEFSRNDHSDIQTLITPKGRETFRLLYTE